MTLMMSITEQTVPFKFVLATITILACTLSGQTSHAASDCDVRVLKVKDVVIGQDKITITAEANIGMVVITPDGETKKSLRFTGRDSTWVKIKADEATFTVLRPHPKLDNEAWTEMSVNAAKALKAGKPIGRIGFYRPEITIRKNRIHAITGRAYIYPKRATAEANRNKERDDTVTEDAEAKSHSRQTIVEPTLQISDSKMRR